MTDRLRLLALLKERGERGVHTSEIRRLGISANASQRRIELLDEGYSIDSIRESFVGADGSKRPGARFILREEPDDVEPASNSGPPLELPAQAPPPPEPEPAGGLGAALFVVEPEPEADYRDPDAWGDAAA